MNLTAKQSRFADYLGHGLNATESYRRAYNASRMSDVAIRVEACRLAKHPKVAARVDFIRRTRPKVENSLPDLSGEWIARRLMDIATSRYATTTTQKDALKVLSRIKSLP
jgi:phage terminase small subunit